MPTERINVSLPEGLLSTLDHTRGDVPRSRWIMRLLERELGTPSVDRDAGGPAGDAPEADTGGGGGPASGPAKPTDARGRAAVPAPVRAAESSKKVQDHAPSPDEWAAHRADPTKVPCPECHRFNGVHRSWCSTR